jgi:DnaJ-class molecular chaperone
MGESSVMDCPRCSGMGVNYGPHYLSGSAPCLLCKGSGKVRHLGGDRYQPAEKKDGEAKKETPTP